MPTREDEDIEPGEGDEPEEPEETGLGNPLTDQARPTRGKDRMKRRPARDIGTTPDPEKFVKQAGSDADLVWNEIVAWLPGVHMAPQDVLISIKRTVPPSAQATPVPVGRAFSGNIVAGNSSETPGSALVQYVIQWLHIPSSPRGVAATYEVYFNYAGGVTHQGRSRAGKQITQAPLSLPSVQELMDTQRAVEFAERQQAGVGSTQVGYQPYGNEGRPALGQRASAPTTQPAYVVPPQAMPSQAPAGIPQEMWGLMGTMMTEVFSAAREGRQPVMPSVTPPAAPTQSELEDRVTGKVMLGVRAMLTEAGVLPQPGAVPVVAAVATPPAAPVAPADNSFEGLVKKGMTGILETVLKTTMTSLETNVKTAMGVGAVPAEETEPAAEIPAPHKPEDDLPFSVAPVGAAWADGRPMQVATSKEDKTIDWMGTAMANPVFAEKAMELANGFGNALKEFLQSRTPGASPQTQVVKQIPPGAVRADTPPPPPNGSGGGGWEAP